MVLRWNFLQKHAAHLKPSGGTPATEHRSSPSNTDWAVGPNSHFPVWTSKTNLSLCSGGTTMISVLCWALSRFWDYPLLAHLCDCVKASEEAPGMSGSLYSYGLPNGGSGITWAVETCNGVRQGNRCSSRNNALDFPLTQQPNAFL